MFTRSLPLPGEASEGPAKASGGVAGVATEYARGMESPAISEVGRRDTLRDVHTAEEINQFFQTVK